MKLHTTADTYKMREYGFNLKIRIMRYGYKSQREFADSCDIPYSVIRNITCGRTPATPEHKRAFAAALKK